MNTNQNIDPVIRKVLTEQNQGQETRSNLFLELEDIFKVPVISFFTSFNFPVMIEDDDADMIEGVLRTLDCKNGLMLIINSPGGDGLAAERIINVCRSYSQAKGYSVIVPGKAKSAATMICFGAQKIYMGATSEIGPIDPQLRITENGKVERFSVYNLIKSYESLFREAVKAKGNLEPYLQQLSHYDRREIEEYKASLSLSENIAIKTLASGMLKSNSENEIKKKINIFLNPKETKTHGRPIYRDDAQNCGLAIEKIDIMDERWKLINELYIRTNNFVSTKVSKCVESKNHSFVAGRQEG